MGQDIKRRSPEELDKLLTTLRPLRNVPVPPEGWLRAVREAMGMSVAQLAERTGLSVAEIERLEHSSSSAGGSFADLRRLADALNCSFVWGLVPHQSLNELLRERAAAVARKRMREVAEMMRRQGRDMTAGEVDHHIEKFSEVLLRELPAALWDFTHDPLASTPNPDR